MTEFLISHFIKNCDNVGDAGVRTRYGTLGSAVGMICNIVLFFIKFLLGSISHSIAVTADAFNNLSDVGSSLVTLLGFKMASKPADREHPFGHGRMEYLSGLIISFFILMVGFEFMKSSFSKIINPEPVEFQWVILIGLIASILVKLWLSRFNTAIGRKIASTAMSATAVDSISDVLATGVTMIAVIAAKFTDVPLDGYMGMIVAAMILFAGYNVAKDTLSPLLGKAPDPVFQAKIKSIALSYDGIIGVHDLIVHDYGPGRIFASMHAEVPITMNIMDSHALIDRVELEMARILGIEIVIHMDPLDTECELTNTIKKQVEHVVVSEDETFSIHDFRIIRSGENINLVFDLSVPIDYQQSDTDVENTIGEKISALDMRYQPKIVIDRIC